MLTPKTIDTPAFKILENKLPGCRNLDRKLFRRRCPAAETEVESPNQFGVRRPWLRRRRCFPLRWNYAGGRREICPRRSSCTV